MTDGLTVPPSFTVVAPPPDGLALAFSSARRRRNSKAAVSAFGGAVAIASVLSFLAPPGQTLVQEPTQPANSGTLLPDVSRPPHPPAPAVQLRTPETPAHSVVVRPAGVSAATLDATGTPLVSTPARELRGACGKTRAILCAVVHSPTQGGPSMRASVCQAAASVTVEYSTPSAVGPTRMSQSRTVSAGGGCSP